MIGDRVRPAYRPARFIYADGTWREVNALEANLRALPETWTQYNDRTRGVVRWKFDGARIDGTWVFREQKGGEA